MFEGAQSVLEKTEMRLRSLICDDHHIELCRSSTTQPNEYKLIPSLKLYIPQFYK